MGWILLQMALLLSLHITAAFAEEEKNKDISNAEPRSLGSFLRNVLDSSQELTKIQNEVRAYEELGGAVRQHPVNHEYSQPRQKRKAKVIPEAKVAGKAAKDPRMLRRVLSLYMKRAQMFRHGKDQNLHEDSQEKFSESHKGKREFHSTYSVMPSDNPQKNSGGFDEACRHKQSSCEIKKMRRRRWGGKSRNYEKKIGNNEKSSSIVDTKLDTVNREAVATSDIQSNYSLSNVVQKGVSDVQNIVPYQENILPVDSMISKQSGNGGSSVNSPFSVIPGSGYDLECVNEIPSLERSLLSTNVKGSSSLVDTVSNVNDFIPTNNVALHQQETPSESKSTKSSLVSQAENLNDQLSLNEMANKQEKLADTPKQTSFNSDGASSGETLDIVNPIVLDVLEKVSKASNETSDNSGNTEGGEQLANVKNIRLPEAHGEIQTKTYSTDNSYRQKSTPIKNKYESMTKGSADKNKVTTVGSLFQKSNENDLTKKQPLRSKTFQTSPENDLKNGQSITSKTFQSSHENDLTKSLLNSGHDFSDESGQKQKHVPLSNIKEKSTQIHKSKWSELLSVHKTPHSINEPIYKPAAPITNSAQKGLTHSGKQKLEKVISPISLYTKNHASLPKSKLDSDIILRTELLHSSKSDKAAISPSKSKNKADNSEVSLKKKTKKFKQKRNTVKETSRIQKKSEDAELKVSIYKRNTRKINGNTPKQQTILGLSKNTFGGNENIKSSNANDISLTSESHNTKEAGQSENTVNDQQLMNVNKRSLKLNEEKQQKELWMTGDDKNVVQENEYSVGHQRIFSEALRRKRHASRLKKHLRKRKRRYRQEGYSKSSSGGKRALKDYNISPYKNIAKHIDSENREDGVRQKMLRQVEDMIFALKEKSNKADLNYGSEFSQRVGRRLHSMIDEAKDNSDTSSDNDDYYYYDEADVDKRRPEHSKVSQKLNRKQTLIKLDPTTMRKKQKYVENPFGESEYLDTENLVNIGYSHNNDPTPNPIQSEQVLSDLITSESNRISRFNKEMPEEVLEARYNHSVTQDEREKNYEENIMKNNNAQSSSRDETKQNSSADKNNPKLALRKIITGNENQPIPRLNEGRLEQLNNELNEILLNQTATSWNDIGQNEIGYNAHMRYKRAGNTHAMELSLKSGGELRVKQENVDEEKNKINELALGKSANTGKHRKGRIFLANSNLSKMFNVEEDKNYKITATNSVPKKNKSSFIVNKFSTLNDTALNYTKNDYNGHNKQNEFIYKATEYKWNAGEDNKSSTTAVNIPLSTKNGTVIINVQTGEFDVSGLNNVTSTTTHSLQHLQKVALSTDGNSKDNYNEDMFPKDTINVENIIGHHEDENKESGYLQEFNSPRYSYHKEKIEARINKNDGLKEKMLNNSTPGKESTTKIGEHNENSKHLLKISNAKDNISHYEPITTEKQQFSEMLQDSPLSPDTVTKFNEMSLESSKVLLRNKRNGEVYAQQTYEELPDYTDYFDESEMDTYDNSSTSGDAIILHIVLDTTDATNESIISGNINNTSGATQHNTYNAAYNSMYVTSPITLDATETRGRSGTPAKPDQGDSDKYNAEKTSTEYQSFNTPKYYNDNSLPSSPRPDQGNTETWNAEKISAGYQSFNIPKYYNDNSQLNNTINGALASKIVDLVFETVNASENLKHHLGGTLKKIDYGGQEKQPSYETGISQEMLEKEEEQYHQKTGILLSKVMELLDVLVEEEVSKRSCISLQPDLHGFLLWMLELPEPGKLAPTEFSVPNNFLFMQRNKRPHNKTKGNEGVKVSVSHLNTNMRELNQQIELLKELIAEYLQLPDSEKAKVNYVHAFLSQQLETLEKMRRSEIVGFRSEVDDESFNGRLAKHRLQDAKRIDANLNNAKSFQSNLRYKGNQHNIPNKALFKESKRPVSPKEDSIYSKMALEHEKSSFKHPSYVSEDYLISNKNTFKMNSDQHSAHKWSNSRKRLMKNVALEAESADSSEIHNPVHPHNPIRPYQRKRRYGGHGHGTSKHKHHNVTHLQVPTMRYRKLLKRAAEFRERRGGLI